MDLVDKFRAYKKELADERTSLIDVELRGGVLDGVADKELEAVLYAFASDYSIGSKVNFIVPTEQFISTDREFLKASPTWDAETVNEAFYGEKVKVYDRQADDYRIATQKDNYLGWVPLTVLSYRLPEPSHQFIGLRGHLFADRNVASKRTFTLSFGAQLHIEEQDQEWSVVRYYKDQAGFVKTSLLAPLDYKKPEPSPSAIIEFAHKFLEAPYVWGGSSAWGLDCSGLSQLVFAAHGVLLPRDSDQQSRCGQAVDQGDIQAGDLLFFPDHVAISLGGSQFIHANAHHMKVSIDDFESSTFGRRLRENLTGIRRLTLS